MRERNVLDDADDIVQLRAMAPEERFVRGLDLSELALGLARARPDGAGPVTTSLAEKSRLWTFRRLARNS